MSDKSDTSLAEQLSAFMDGQLEEEQARFLRRRLEHDAELRAAWSRLQLASSCLKGHAVLPMALDCAAVRADVPVSGARRGWVRWAVAASVAALAVTLAPRLVQGPGTPASPMASPTVVADASARREIPSPSSADLVAFRPVAPTAPAARSSAAASAAATTGPAPQGRGLVATSAAAPSSPLSLDAQSPAEFPLVDTGEKSWPRSGLPAVGGDPQLEAYLVRHNQMLANDALGGFVPYVDVVARDPARSAADTAPAESASQEPATK